jgi:hypothetical protein
MKFPELPLGIVWQNRCRQCRKLAKFLPSDNSIGVQPSDGRIQLVFRTPAFGRSDLISRSLAATSCIRRFRFFFSRSCHDSASSSELAVDTGRGMRFSIMRVWFCECKTLDSFINFLFTAFHDVQFQQNV